MRSYVSYFVHLYTSQLLLSRCITLKQFYCELKGTGEIMRMCRLVKTCIRGDCVISEISCASLFIDSANHKHHFRTFDAAFYPQNKTYTVSKRMPDCKSNKFGMQEEGFRKYLTEKNAWIQRLIRSFIWTSILTLWIRETPKRVLWQTVKTKMKCSIVLHFIRVCTACRTVD